MGLAFVLPCVAMAEDLETRDEARLRRSGWPVLKRTLATMDEASALHATPSERLAMVWELSVRTYALAGIEDVVTPRSQWPSRLKKLGSD